MTRSQILGAAVLVGGLSFGCGSYSVPMVAAEGTTIMLPVPNGYGTGFSRVISDAMLAQYPSGQPIPASFFTNNTVSIPYDPGSSLEDEIRGELVLQLTELYGTHVSYLPIRYITRVHSDETSVSGHPGTWPGLSRGQVVAFVDVPDGAIPHNYGHEKFRIYVRKYTRMSGTPEVFEETTPLSEGFPWTGWGSGVFGMDHSLAPIPIKLVKNPDPGPSYNPFTAFEDIIGYARYEVETSLKQELVPRPTLGLVMFKGWGVPNPAAWEASVSFPRSTVQVIGAELNSTQKSTATLIFKPDDDTSSQACPGGTGTVTVSVIDPRKLANQVRLILEPRDLEECGRVASSDFQASGSARAWDENGVDLGPGWVLYNSGEIR